MRSRRRASWTAVAACLVVAACATAGGGGGTREDASRISAEQLEANHTLDLLTLIQRVRPRWLQPRGSMTFRGEMPAAVFVDGVSQLGGPSSLRSIPVSDVESVEFLSANDATTRYGTNMAGGAILVTRRR